MDPTQSPIRWTPASFVEAERPERDLTAHLQPVLRLGINEAAQSPFLCLHAGPPKAGSGPGEKKFRVLQ